MSEPTLTTFALDRLPIDWSAYTDKEVTEFIDKVQDDPEGQVKQLVETYIKPHQEQKQKEKQQDDSNKAANSD